MYKRKATRGFFFYLKKKKHFPSLGEKTRLARDFYTLCSLQRTETRYPWRIMEDKKKYIGIYRIIIRNDIFLEHETQKTKGSAYKVR